MCSFRQQKQRERARAFNWKKRKKADRDMYITRLCIVHVQMHEHLIGNSESTTMSGENAKEILQITV